MSRSQFDFEQLVETEESEANVRGSLAIPDEALSQGHVNLALDDTDDTSGAKQGALQPASQHPLSDLNLSSAAEGTNQTNSASHPVMYSTGTGSSKVVNEKIVIQQTNGENMIQTQQTSCQNVPERWRDIERSRPLRKKHIRFLKVFSVITIILFFPLGIPAAYFAFNLQKEFDKGIMQGNIDRAQSYRKKAERLIIFAVLFAILLAVLIFAVVERSLMSNEELAESDSMRNRVLPKHGNSAITG